MKPTSIIQISIVCLFLVSRILFFIIKPQRASVLLMILSLLSAETWCTVLLFGLLILAKEEFVRLQYTFPSALKWFSTLLTMENSYF